MKPLCRTQNLTIEKVGDETIVYDSETHKAHSLNRVAEAVWRACDGKTTPEAIAERLRTDFDASADLPVIERALHDLGEANLLYQAPQAFSRRDISAYAAVLIPIVTSILIPPPAAAKSGKVKDHPQHPNHPSTPRGRASRAEQGVGRLKHT